MTDNFDNNNSEDNDGRHSASDANITEAELRALATNIKRWATELGFQQVGITDTNLNEHRQHLQRWLDHGYHGQMSYMEERKASRFQPALLQPATVRVISLRMDYLPSETDTIKLLDQPDKAYLSRYALGRDYHKLIRKRIAQLAEKINQHIGPRRQRPFVDSAPVLERAFAEKAGLGWIGKNTMLINSTAGSWFFLGELFTDLALPIDPITPEKHCGSCRACLDICPTDAFVGPFELDARKCISYLTIEKSGDIPIELRDKMGNRVFGCDDCQLICPWNKFAKPSTESDFTPRHQLDQAELVELLLWTEDEFERYTRGSAIRRIGYEHWLRNLAVGVGNGNYSERAVNALKTQASYSALVQEHAQWAIDKLLRKTQ